MPSPAAPGNADQTRARVIALALLLVLAALLLVPPALRGESFSYDGELAAPFGLEWAGLERAEERPGELLRLEGEEEGSEQTLVIAPLAESPTAGEDSESLALAALAVAGEPPDAASGADELEIVLEGRARVGLDRGPRAHQIAFTSSSPASSDDALLGKLLLVPPSSDRGAGVTILVTERTGSATVAEKLEQARSGLLLNWPFQIYLESEVSVRTGDLLEDPLKSFSWE